MKKLRAKLPSAAILKRGKSSTQPASRITNETVAEHRERILAGGRKFKYPVQYSRHKLVVNSILIILVSLALLSIVLWWQLYPSQNTSKFMYRVTQILPLPVARVDGQFVAYSDYLKKYRSSLHFLQTQNDLSTNSADGRRQIEVIKRRELDGAIKDTYTRHIAQQNNVSVSSSEVDSFVSRELKNKKVSEQAYERTVLSSFYDWSLSDYKGVVRAELLKRKVSFKIDRAARDKADRIFAQLVAGGDFAAIARTESEDDITKASGGDAGTVALTNADPHGITAALTSLQPGQLTKIIEGADGYYIAKLVSKNDQSMQYSFIKIGFQELDKRFEMVKKAGKIQEYINITLPTQ